MSNDTRLPRLILGSMRAVRRFAREISRGKGSGITPDRPIRWGTFDALFQQTTGMNPSGDRSHESLI
ncbi:MAG: hypothetical protein ACRC8Y_11000 [Chroococcales cyanobacterium]